MMPNTSFCNHSFYWLARPDCPKCIEFYGRIPESPAFQGSFLKRQLLILVNKLKKHFRKKPPMTIVYPLCQSCFDTICDSDGHGGTVCPDCGWRDK